MRIGARFDEEFYELRVTEDNREDERRLAAAGALIYVRAVGQQGGHSLFVAGRNGTGQ